MKGNVIDLAVGVVIGAAFGKIVSSLVNDVIMPPIGLAIGNVDFKDLAYPIGTNPAGEPVLFKYGLFIQTIFEFMIIAFALFMLIKGINRLKRPQPAAPAAASAAADQGGAAAHRDSGSRWRGSNCCFPAAKRAWRTHRASGSRPPVRGDRQVVFDSDATERSELIDSVPVDLRAPMIAASAVEQLIDEVEPRLHRDDEVLFEHTREPQERVPFRARDHTTFR